MESIPNSHQKIITRISEGPAVLLLGQSYLGKGKEHAFLHQINEKYQIKPEQTISYNDLLARKRTGEEAEHIFKWMHKLSDNMSIPLEYEMVASFPWSHVYTSAIDTVVLRMLRNEWRQIRPVYNDKDLLLNLRNQQRLHLTYLFGCVNQLDSKTSPPFNKFSLKSRTAVSKSFLTRLPEILTPRGILLIDGLDLEEDWLSFEDDLYSLIRDLGSEQVVLFGIPEDTENEFLDDLIEAGKIMVFEESLDTFLLMADAAGLLSIPQAIDEEYLGHWVRIEDKKVPVSQALWNKTINWATILDNDLCLPEVMIDKNDPVQVVKGFENFLRQSGNTPDWSGYYYNYCFERDFQIELKEQIELIRKEQNIGKATIEGLDRPLIVHGQSSVGKTVGLGMVAYEYACQRKKNIPVLFIERKYQLPSVNDIEEVCRYFEKQGAKQTLIIWDGMQSPAQYESFLKRLDARGRQVILVGTCYRLKSKKTRSSRRAKRNKRSIIKKQYIEVRAKLSAGEKDRFTKFLRRIDPVLVNSFTRDKDAENFLVILFHYLVESRHSIAKGLASEANYTSKIIIEESLKSRQAAKKKPAEKPLLGQLLMQAGVDQMELAPAKNQDKTEAIADPGGLSGG